MNQESPTQTQAAPTQEGIQSGLAARSEAMQSIAKAKENLGQVAASHEFNVDAHGVVMTPKDVAEHATRGAHDEVRI